jgi:hypothetical protein
MSRYEVELESLVGFQMAMQIVDPEIECEFLMGQNKIVFFEDYDYEDYVEKFVLSAIPIKSTNVIEEAEEEYDNIIVEEIVFKENELVNSYNTISGDYEDFMMLTIIEDSTVNDVIVVDEMPFDPESETSKMKKALKDAKKELANDISEDEEGYVYICTREDNISAVGLAISEVPLRKATQEDWTVIL